MFRKNPIYFSYIIELGSNIPIVLLVHVYVHPVTRDRTRSDTRECIREIHGILYSADVSRINFASSRRRYMNISEIGTRAP